LLLPFRFSIPVVGKNVEIKIDPWFEHFTLRPQGCLKDRAMIAQAPVFNALAPFFALAGQRRKIHSVCRRSLFTFPQFVMIAR
jgi:hypothetical protein